MAHLTLVGLSADKTRLLLVDDSGHEFTLDVNAHLRAALRGDNARLGQLEIQMESALRPRDIQARIRAGETAEQVAQAAQTTVDKIMAFAAPVLAERAHIAERAQRASVRRKPNEVGARTLGDAVEAHLHAVNLPASGVEWDSWRREDGRWTVTADYSSSKRTGSARFSFDAPGNFVVAENDDAKWLIGELTPKPQADPRDDLKSARQRRLTSVPADELPLGDDAIELVTDHDSTASTQDLSETAAHVRRQHPVEDTLGAEPPPEAFLDQVFAAQNPADRSSGAPVAGDDLVDGAAAVAAPESDDVAQLDDRFDDRFDDEPEDHPEGEHHLGEKREPPHRREVKKSRGRASVPSWDEIMFGGGKQD